MPRTFENELNFLFPLGAENVEKRAQAVPKERRKKMEALSGEVECWKGENEKGGAGNKTA